MKLHVFLAVLLGSLTVLSSVLSPVRIDLPDSAEQIARLSREELETRVRRYRRLFTPPMNSDPSDNPVVRGVTAIV